MKNLDVDRLTLGEIATIESLGEMPIDAIGDDNRPKGKMLAALAMIAKRRNGFPAFKWGDALGLSMSEAMEVLGIEDEPVDVRDEHGVLEPDVLEPDVPEDGAPGDVEEPAANPPARGRKAAPSSTD